MLLARKLYLDRRADRGWRAALTEKERTIQRLAEQEREWRTYFVMHMGMTQQEAEKLIQRNEFSTPEQARKALEGSRTKQRRVPRN